MVPAFVSGSGKSRTHLDERAIRAAHKILELVGHRRHDIGFDRDQQILSRSAVLQDYRERVVDVTFDAAKGTEESCHRLRPPEEDQCLVDGVASCLPPRQYSGQWVWEEPLAVVSSFATWKLISLIMRLTYPNRMPCLVQVSIPCQSFVPPTAESRCHSESRLL